jgi:hypothetical protein
MMLYSFSRLRQVKQNELRRCFTYFKLALDKLSVRQSANSLQERTCRIKTLPVISEEFWEWKGWTSRPNTWVCLHRMDV